METTTFPISGPLLLRPKRIEDSRGFFSETYNERLFREALGDVRFVQDNQSLSTQAGTIRGLHFQSPPAEQGKLVRVLRGAVFDVAVDIRRGSPTYGKFVSATLSAENWTQLWVPAGFAHGFCTLEPDSEVLYKVTSYYSRGHDLGLAWDDPELDIPWPVAPGRAVLSDKDHAHPMLRDLPAYFS
ncbi:dTDP-4-dehydrorhamnose 3,5-epimerase [Methylovirgula ligni]|uniref:dTDP-4-dehydrorhamnose 3,5-epimerase n=1 Tax=Methylovirgula ligni TaxID=569860 RepID=A0A3D9Z2E0_9HYPH|nr:dTDP-4-dehydrorhamnose 3,5-epimerase [Methylovirgula ligni]QAY95424.1 dTDP-4-dehydrorhamnose 3,5-epimerase [Methylovirgula ligni]REF89251.1 dTDP-4-dehydrorhamnose 3,5-epimerase [Methylovirgula ligni]